MPSSAGSSSTRRVKTPSVTTSMRVRREIFDPNRTRYPTVSPALSPSVRAMRSAAARAAIRRGSSTRILRPFAQACSASTSGTRVVLPAPGGATSTAASRVSSAAVSAGSTSSIGSGGSNGLINGPLTASVPPRCGTARGSDMEAPICPTEKETQVLRNGSAPFTRSSTTFAPPGRVDWVDYAKGFCIVMVVMMHSTLGVEAEAGREGFMHWLVAFAKPFRMPDFFLISGLFLARVIDRDWRDYLDKKVVHFAYFYVLWVTIQFGFKAPGFAAEHGWAHVGYEYLLSFIEPFGTLWFIYLLPIFFVVIKLTRRAPAILIFAIAMLLESAHVATGWTAIDEFCARFVYIYSGYIFADYV